MSGEKSLFGGPSKDAIFSLSHTLNGFVDQIEYSLNAKESKHVLSGRTHNDPIDHRFSASRCLGGNNLALCVHVFDCNERVLLLYLNKKSCTNQDGSRNRML